MPYVRVILRPHRISRYRNLGILRCAANDCPAPTLGMSEGDTVLTRTGHGRVRTRIYHEYCGLRKGVPVRKKQKKK